MSYKYGKFINLYLVYKMCNREDCRYIHIIEDENGDVGYYHYDANNKLIFQEGKEGLDELLESSNFK